MESTTIETTDVATTPAPPVTPVTGDLIALPEFIAQFGAGLLDAVRTQNPPIYAGQRNPRWDAWLDGLLRKPFEQQREVILAITTLLTQHANGGIINAEMGTGKTLMGIAVATLMHHLGHQRTLVIAPPHLGSVYI